MYSLFCYRTHYTCPIHPFRILSAMPVFFASASMVISHVYSYVRETQIFFFWNGGVVALLGQAAQYCYYYYYSW